MDTESILTSNYNDNYKKGVFIKRLVLILKSLRPNQLTGQSFL